MTDREAADGISFVLFHISTSAEVEDDARRASCPDMRKAFRAGMTERHGQVEERSEVTNETKQNEDRKDETNIVRSAHSLFKNLVVSAEGVPHFQSGAVDYKTSFHVQCRWVEKSWTWSSSNRGRGNTI